MNNKPDTGGTDEKKAKTMELLRKVWTGLILVFIVVILLNLYNWWQGKGDLRGILSPLAMIFVGLATIFAKRKGWIHYTFLALALIFVVASLILLVYY